LFVPRQSITSLIYVSTARPGLDQDEFLSILGVAERNNQRVGITGLILYNGFNFIQCLEGDRASVNDRLYHIGLDDRHNGLTILSHDDMPSRQFAQWSMAGQYLPIQQGLLQADVAKILSDDAVIEATRRLFESFLSLGAKQSIP